VPKPEVIQPTALNTSEMLWCEPPEKLENVLKYQLTDTSHLPLISIAQINNNDMVNDNSSVKTTTESVITTTLSEILNSTFGSLANNETNFSMTNVSTESPEKLYHPHGTEIIFKCIPTMNGLKNTWKITCEDGGWIGRAVKCGDYHFSQ